MTSLGPVGLACGSDWPFLPGAERGGRLFQGRGWGLADPVMEINGSHPNQHYTTATTTWGSSPHARHSATLHIYLICEPMKARHFTKKEVRIRGISEMAQGHTNRTEEASLGRQPTPLTLFLGRAGWVRASQQGGARCLSSTDLVQGPLSVLGTELGQPDLDGSEPSANCHLGTPRREVIIITTTATS